MQVDVVGDARARDAAEVPAEVEPARAVDALEDVDGGDGQAMDLERLVVGQLGELAHVAARSDHEMPGRVWELVQEHQRGRARVHAQRLPTAGSSSAASTQKTQPSCSSAWTMYSSRHGAHRGLRHGAVLPVLARAPRGS